MKQVILTVGLPASGKSTWSKEIIDKNPNSYKRINKDLLRDMLDNNHFSKDSEKFILDVRDALILMALEKGKHVIIDDTNFSSKHENRIRELIKDKAELIIKDFTHVPIEVCIERDLKRPNSVGEKVIKEMYNQHIKPKPEVIEVIDGLPFAVICDLDGTLALLNGRNPYDASTCDNDILNTVVASIIKDKTVLLVSGREDKYREPTIKFLEKNNIKYESLFMRPTGDFRKDSIIKREIFNNNIRGKYNIEFVVDDRLQVCRMWYDLGLNLLKVGDPESDF
jgi:predicted kinase